MIYFFIFIFILYVILIVLLSVGFKKVREFTFKNNNPTTTFSVIVPFRNEAKHLPQLLNSISQLNYPKDLVEFIFVDDNSSDDSVEIIKKTLNTFSQDSASTAINTRVLKNNRNSNSPKKDAITTAISEAKHNWIVTTDADCLLPVKWLETLDSYIQKNTTNMVVAPVNYKAKNNFLEQFQLLDFVSMQATTIGGFGIDFPFLCNGANLAYKKEVFLQLKGFKGNNNIASGDDIFLFEKFLEFDKKSVQYLKSKNAIIDTFPVKSWKALIQQRTRWAAKTSNFKSYKVKLIGVVILLTNIFVITYVFVGSIKIMYVPLALKVFLDWMLLKPTLQFFDTKLDFLKWYIPASFIYPFFSTYVIFKSVFFTYTWKGRSFKK